MYFINNPNVSITMSRGSVSPRYGAFSGCEWRDSDTDSLERPSVRKIGMRFGMWNVKSLVAVH
jgi:hypothetical protein